MIKAKDDEIEILNTKVLELKKELEFREETDKDFEVLQKIAEDEADTISGLEKENLKVVKALHEMETIVRKDKEKIKMMEDALDEERNSMLDKLAETMSEVEAQKTKYEEMQHVLTVAREDIIKLEQENAKLKEQEETNGKNKAPAQDIDYENKTQVEEQEPRKKGAE